MNVSGAEDIGIIARQRRQDLEMSQVELAARAGVTRQWLTRFERGNSEVTLSKAIAVLRELDLRTRIDPVALPGALPEARLTYNIPLVATSRIEAQHAKTRDLLAINNSQKLAQVRDRITALDDADRVRDD